MCVCADLVTSPRFPFFLVQGAIEHANNRVQFGDKLRNFALIKGKFASMELKVCCGWPARERNRRVCGDTRAVLCWHHMLR